MPTTEAEKRAIKNYLSKKDDIKVRVPKGDKERYKAHAATKEKSLNALIIELLERDIENTRNITHNVQSFTNVHK